MKIIESFMEDGSQENSYELRSELHNGRPAWDLKGSLHYSLCWTPFKNSEFGFWSVANLYTLDDNGQATGIVFNTPEIPIGDGPQDLPVTATKSDTPPLGWWTRGRPWAGDRTSGGRQMELRAGA